MKVLIKEMQNEKIGVLCPYTPYFTKRAKRLSGIWHDALKLWVFDAILLVEVKKALMAVYLTDGSPCETTAIKITANGTLSKTRGPVTLNGFAVASAFGKTSGSKPCAGVALISGKIHSGGSMKYWETIVDDGATFILSDMPVAWLQQTDDDWTIEPYSEKKIDRNAFEAEKQNLLKRLAEIDELLNSYGVSEK